MTAESRGERPPPASPTITGATPIEALPASERIARLNYLAVNIRHARIPPTDLRREVVAAIRDLQDFVREEEASAPDLLAEAREICAILDLYRADTGEEPCFDHEAIGEEVARRHASLTAAIAQASGEGE